MTEFDLNRQGAAKYTIEDLITVVRRLFAPDGCPWDRVQTHESIRKNMVEEAYEAVDAIDSGRSDRIADELGDVLLQVLMHSAIAERDSEFTFEDVTDNLSRKLISRHSHVFGTDTADTPDAVLTVWDKNKMREKGHASFSETLADVPAGLPALMRADKLQKRAAKAGFDWPDAAGARAKIGEELAEVEDVLLKNGKPLYGKLSAEKDTAVHREAEAEVGDLLFACVNYARLLGIDPEVALNRTNAKFIRRFTGVETLAAGEGRKLDEMPLEEMDLLWDRVKQMEKTERE
jgi:tetrapyrrole methylase family protein/MazG family protein